MAFVSIAASAVLLVVAMATAYPMHNEKMMDEDLIKAIRYLWNEEMRKDQHAEAMNLWSEEKDQNSVYAMRDDGEDRDKDDKDRDGGEKGDKIETINYIWNEKEKDIDKDGKGDRAAEQRDDSINARCRSRG